MRTRLLCVLLLFLAAACASASKDAALAKTLAGVGAARDAFTAWDARHQTALVDGAASLNAGTVALTEYRGKRDKLTLAFVAAYGALAAASIDGTAASFEKATTAATALLAALKELGVIP
jgi:hypothetical protein